MTPPAPSGCLSSVKLAASDVVRHGIFSKESDDSSVIAQTAGPAIVVENRRFPFDSSETRTSNSGQTPDQDAIRLRGTLATTSSTSGLASAPTIGQRSVHDASLRNLNASSISQHWTQTPSMLRSISEMPTSQASGSIANEGGQDEIVFDSEEEDLLSSIVSRTTSRNALVDPATSIAPSETIIESVLPAATIIESVLPAAADKANPTPSTTSSKRSRKRTEAVSEDNDPLYLERINAQVAMLNEQSDDDWGGAAGSSSKAKRKKKPSAKTKANDASAKSKKVKKPKAKALTDSPDQPVRLEGDTSNSAAMVPSEADDTPVQMNKRKRVILDEEDEVAEGPLLKAAQEPAAGTPVAHNKVLLQIQPKVSIESSPGSAVASNPNVPLAAPIFAPASRKGPLKRAVSKTVQERMDKVEQAAKGPPEVTIFGQVEDVSITNEVQDENKDIEAAFVSASQKHEEEEAAKSSPVQDKSTLRNDKGKAKSARGEYKKPRLRGLAAVMEKTGVHGLHAPGLSARHKIPRLHTNLKPAPPAKKALPPVKTRKKEQEVYSDEERPWYETKDPEEWDSDDREEWRKIVRKREMGLDD